MKSIKITGGVLIFIGSSFVALQDCSNGSPAPFNTNLLTNGSFEKPLVDVPLRPQYQEFEFGSDKITGWQVTGGPGMVRLITCPTARMTEGIFAARSENYCDAAQGNQYLNLATQGSSATISQTVTTIQGGEYYVVFSVAAAQQVPVATMIRVTVAAGKDPAGTDVLLDEFISSKHLGLDRPKISCTKPDHPLCWGRKAFVFQATSAMATITFADDVRRQGTFGGLGDASLIDDVVVVASPFVR
jgi:hypothetical protein